jgi:murein L,D-transpeptidase YcbB/YkuD
MKTPDKRRIELEEIRRKNNIDYKTLAEWAGIDYDVLWRQFNTAKHFRDDVGEAVEEALTKHGYIISEDNQIEKIKDELLDSETIINGAISMMNRSFLEKIKDKKFDPKEKADYKNDVKRIQNKINDALDTIILTIDMK